jgi:hyperosmotically inducible protein
MRHDVRFAAAVLAAALCAAPALAADKVERTTDRAADKVDRTTDRATDKVDRTTDRVRDTSRQATTAMSDTWLTAKTKIALYGDDRVSGTQINVDTTKGVVHLRGKVDSEAAKRAAEDVAKGIEGVTGVKNDLQVVAPARQAAVEAKDEEINKAVESRMNRDRQLAGVDAQTSAGVVTLTGEVPSVTASARASEMARQVPGVRSVKNQLTTDAKMDRAGDRRMDRDKRMERTSARPGDKIERRTDRTADNKVVRTDRPADRSADRAADKPDRSATTAMSDTWLTAKTKIALYADDRVAGNQINVDTLKGVVHLRGGVDS